MSTPPTEASTNLKRNSYRTSTASPQLPLPTAVNQNPHRPQPISVPRSGNSTGAGPSSPPLKTTGSGRTPSPSRSNFPAESQPVQSTSTHAGGILPSASFFRPSRPNQQNNHYVRPESTGSGDGLPPASDGDVFQLSPLGRQISHSSDGHGGSLSGGGNESIVEDDQFASMKRLKKSREPLIPLSSRTAGLFSRPSISRERSGTSNASRSAKSIVRNSLDRVFNLSRGMSVDSLHRPTTVRPSRDDTSVDDARFYEGKVHDEENGIFDRPPSLTGRKDSMSPDNYSPALNVTHAPHHPRDTPSPDTSFDPTPPAERPSLSAIPLTDPKTGKFVRNYQRHPSRNRFFLDGRLLTGGDSPWAFIATFSLWVGIAGVWFGTTAVWWWQNASPAVAIIGAYLALLTITMMLTTATSDPGILPRGLDPDPPYPATSPSDGGVRAPMPRDLKVRADVVRVKYCPTCKTYRPPRSSHCKMCDNCVDGCDHHCQWVNNCVGQRNYTSFFVLLLVAVITLILIICTSALHLYLLTRREHINFREALSKGAGSAVAFCLSISVIWPVSALLSYHMRLLLLNITTIEQIRNQAHKSLVPGPAPPNPFSHGSWGRNLMAVLCRPSGFSWLDSHGVLTEDKREINPGLMSD